MQIKEWCELLTDRQEISLKIDKNNHHIYATKDNFSQYSVSFIPEILYDKDGQWQFSSQEKARQTETAESS